MPSPRKWRSEPTPSGPFEETTLSSAVSEILTEARTVIPGVQAFIGFQLVAVFNGAFWEKLQEQERFMHLGAILLNVFAMVLLITPAVFHRERESGYDSAGLVKLASRMLMASTFPLILAIALDLYLIGRVIGDSVGAGLVATLFVLAPATFFWHIVPRVKTLGDWLRS